jgi:hypothetical protein
MAPAYSKVASTDATQIADRLIHHLASDPAPICYVKSSRASAKHDDTMYHEFEYSMHSASPETGTKMKTKTLMFEDGDAEMWCDWRIEFDDLIRLAPLESGTDKINAALTLLKGKALQHFKEYQRVETVKEANRPNPDERDDNDLFNEIIDDVAKEFFPVNHAYRRQIFYMKYHLFIGGKTGVRDFIARVHRINSCIPYFPRKNGKKGLRNCKKLGEDELCDILNLAKKPEWTIRMLEANQDPYDFDLQELTEYLERLETASSIFDRRDRAIKDVSNGKKKRKPDDDGKKNNQQFKKKPRTTCPICKKFHKGDCWYKDDKNKKVQFDKGKTKPSNKFTMNEYSNMMKVMMETSKNFQKNPKSAKRKVSTQGNFRDSDSDREEPSQEERHYMNMLTNMPDFTKYANHPEVLKAHWGEDDESVASA